MKIIIITVLLVSIFVYYEDVDLNNKEFIKKRNIEKKATSNFKIEDLGRNKGLTLIETEMRDQPPSGVNKNSKFLLIYIQQMALIGF